jgi:hypothetical protein
MNTMHELLMPELAELRMAERQAEAAAERLARELRDAAGGTRRWTLNLRLRLPVIRRGAAKPA